MRTKEDDRHKHDATTKQRRHYDEKLSVSSHTSESEPKTEKKAETEPEQELTSYDNSTSNTAPTSVPTQAPTTAAPNPVPTQAPTNAPTPVPTTQAPTRSGNSSSKALMVIAVYPSSNIKYSAIWSQLECLAGDIDQIIISAPTQFRENVTEFITEVNATMPAIGKRLKARFYLNGRYDAGLWCDALIKGNVLETGAGNTRYVGGSSQYDRFLLINDSLMAVEKSNELLETLKSKNASLVSLNYWGNKENSSTHNDTDNTKYWLESPARAFSLEGIQVYADKVCLLPHIEWQSHCPYLKGNHQSKAKKIKKCVVIRTEVEVVDNYSLDKVHGLYPGGDGTARHWSHNFTFWAGLRDQMSFPVLKVTNGGLVAKVRRNRPQDTERCTVKRNSKSGISRIKPPLKCKCVDCEEDELCGGLWNANKYPGNDDPHTKKIHIVVSHCKHDLDWIYDFTKGYNIASIHVISKCGAPVNGAPDIATIQVLPNVGRCDHTYVYYMSTVLHQKVEKGDEKDSIIVFLKDEMSAANLHQPGKWNDCGSMVRLASTTNGFACGIVPAGLVRLRRKKHFFMSAYHEVKTLFKFTIDKYERNEKGYASDGVEFKSVYANLGSFYDSLGAGPLPEIVQVCYGGAFAASVSNIKKRDMPIWKALEKTLSRGNNIAEGHYAERSWAYLLSTPLQPFQVEALRNHSDTIQRNIKMKGALLKKG